jgi:oxygen-independent coproporphyrinogen-3 oxidase
MYVYIHVPFCQSRCIYCDFYLVLAKHAPIDKQTAYVDAICREIRTRFEQSASPLTPIETVYIGGGTPSLLPASAYARIFETLNAYAPFADSPELTLELNPNGVSDALESYLAVGFNRFSVGIQSFDAHELKKLSRNHSPDDAMALVHELTRAGATNLSIDLMYGTPNQTMANWKETLETACSLPIQHISMYGLKVEESTPLARLIPTGSYPIPDDDATVSMYEMACERLEAGGFGLYEISNLAKPGFESRHNLNYWNNRPFWAFGVSAHGYWDNTRYETVRDLNTYLDNPLAGDVHVCTREEQLENAIIFGLRKTEGIDVSAMETEFGIDFRRRYHRVLDKFVPTGLLEWKAQKQGENLCLSRKAIPVSNGILSEFLI